VITDMLDKLSPREIPLHAEKIIADRHIAIELDIQSIQVLKRHTILQIRVFKMECHCLIDICVLILSFAN